MRRWKLAFISIVFGLLSNIAIAWVISLNYPGAHTATESESTLRWVANTPSNWPDTPNYSYLYRSRGVKEYFQFRSSDNPNDSVDILGYIERTAFGWPLVSMDWTWFYSRHPDFLRDAEESGTLVRGVRFQVAGYTPYRGTLPLHPNFPGFIVNTIFWGVLFWVILACLGLLLRRRRVRKGHCPNCNYQLAGLTSCPECGTQSTREQPA